MQFSAARRTGKTYGKASRNVVHDLFDHRAPRDVDSSTISQDAPSSTSPNKGIEDVSRAAPLNGKSRPTSTTILPSTTSKFPRSTGATDENIGLYDMQSSDDDTSTDTSGSRTSKRRRTGKSVLSSKTSNQKAAPIVAAKIQKVQNDTDESIRTAGIVPPMPKSMAQSKKLPTTKAMQTLPGSTSKIRQTYTKLPGMITSKPLPHIMKNKKPVFLPSEEDTVMLEQPTVDASDYLSDQSHQSTKLDTTTPKRKRASPATTDSEVSSPSNLGVTGLKLNPKALSPAPSSPGLSSDGSMAQTKGRRRLIDRLDAPTHSVGHTSEEHTSDDPTRSATKRTPKPVKTYSKLTEKDDKFQMKKPSMSAEGSEKSQSRTGWPAKPRATYATQRSHLSDMVDELDILSAPSSQNSTDQLLMQTSKSNIASQLDLESEDSEDMAGVNKLKSIHELRQAGAVTRFDREVDALLEDIGVNEQSSKALRLQALMKLTHRLRDSDFLRHLAISGRALRLTAIAAQVEDLPSSILLGRAFTYLSRSENVTLDVLGHLFRAAADLAPVMLADDRALSKIAKDRKENLSKATMRDLIEFEKSAANEVEESQPQPNQLCADIVAMNLLDNTLRKMIHLGNTSAKVSTKLYSQILRILCLQTQHLKTLEHDLFAPTKLEAALFLLELCSVVVDDADLRIADDEYIKLGGALAEIIMQTDKLRKPLDQGVLRVVVSLSNNKPRLCRLFGATPISKAVFGIINDNFLMLARQAEDEENMDESKLDSVLLSLGCLLNFAESDSTLRTRLAETKPDHNHPITQLVSIFNTHVSKVDEAMTKEQGQISVAFGYLSMLLCALSLNPSIKRQITQLLRRKSFEELCMAARKFFSHVQTLEHISDDDTSMSTFIARFEAILETIQDASTESMLV